MHHCKKIVSLECLGGSKGLSYEGWSVLVDVIHEEMFLGTHNRRNGLGGEEVRSEIAKE